MEEKIIVATQRDVFKKGAMRRLRESGRIPAIMYGGKANKALSVNEHDFKYNFGHASESSLFKLVCDDQEHQVLIKSMQKNILKSSIEHIDFFEITKGQTVTINVPLIFTGNPAGVREGGIIEQLVHEIEVVALPTDLPPSISVDISGLNVNESLHVADLPLLKGVTYHINEGQPLVTVKFTKAEQGESSTEETPAGTEEKKE